MHKRFVANFIARLLLIVSACMLMPLGWAIYEDPHSLEVKAFVATIALGSVWSGLVLAFFPIHKEDYWRINAKDGLAIVGLSWIVLSAVGALPLYWAEVVSHYTDALFEIASGFTTTGATIFPDVEVLPMGILFWRSLTHWLGGMGIIVLYVALLPALGTHAFQLYKAEAPGLMVERVEPKIKETAKKLWTIYFFLSALETVCLMALGMSVFDALCHTFGTMATGGFSTRNASIGVFSPQIQWVITLFMFLAGCNFILHYQAMRGHWRSYMRNEEFRFYLWTISGMTILTSLVLQAHGADGSAWREGAFQVVSIMTTTGFTTADFDMWPQVLRYALLLLMILGGCGGSTGGGMKMIRVLVSIKTAAMSLVQAVYPNAVVPVKFNRRALPDRVIVSVLTYFVVFFVLFLSGAMVLTATENCTLITAVSASISALSNIGPGLGDVGATKNFAWISLPGKWTLIALMLAGRLELYAVLTLLLPATWKK